MIMMKTIVMMGMLFKIIYDIISIKILLCKLAIFELALVSSERVCISIDGYNNLETI